VRRTPAKEQHAGLKYRRPVSTFGLSSRRRIVRPSPLFLVVVGITAIGGIIAWTQQAPSSRFGDFGVFVLVLGGWVISVCFHEFAHAFAAYRAGDRSVEMRGYLTLNPFKYAHPVLSLLLPLIAIVGGGFALPGGAVYLHPHTFRTRTSRALAAAVGPLTNLILAVLLILLWQNFGSGHLRFWSGLAFLGFLQVTAAVLNLVPIPGLDGYAIIEPFLDPETRRLGDKVKPWGMLIVLLLLFYVNPIKDGFLHLTRLIHNALGGNDFFEVGYYFFQFWHNPVP
jgi:Zn-dependent protease